MHKQASGLRGAVSNHMSVPLTSKGEGGTRGVPYLKNPPEAVQANVVTPSCGYFAIMQRSGSAKLSEGDRIVPTVYVWRDREGRDHVGS